MTEDFYEATPGMRDSEYVFAGLTPFLRVRPELRELCRFGPQWAAPHERDDSGWAPFHIVTRGRALLDSDDCRGLVLDEGDVVILPHGGRHTLRASDSTETSPPTQKHRLPNGLLLKTNAEQLPQTQIVCGRLRYERAGDNMVLAALPNVVVIHASEGRDATRIRDLVAMMREELSEDRPGTVAIACELARALVTIVLRAHLERQEARSGVLALLSGAETGRALRAILTAPGKHWTLDELAHEAGTSRATVVRLFRKATDKAPLAFLAELRLNIAHQRLLSDHRSLAKIAEEVGYGSESTLSRAYRRRFGIAPGAVRAGAHDPSRTH